MEKLKQIGHLCSTYNITPKTIRFYEEKGLIQSKRDPQSGYRLFNLEIENRLKLILLLRELDVSIKEVQQILKSNSVQKTVEVLNNKLTEIDSNIINYNKLKDRVQFIIDASLSFQSNILTDFEKNSFLSSYSNKKNKNKGREKMNQNQLNNLTANDVKIIKLNKSTVAYVNSGLVKQPEGKAVTELMKWIRKTKLYENSNIRIFGYDNPSPQTNDFDNEVYGYEICVTLPDGFDNTEGIATKEFEGGLYATVSFSFASGTDTIPKRWQQLVEWVKNSDYTFREAQYFEEYLCRFDEDGNDEYDNLEFYLPIVKK